MFNKKRWQTRENDCLYGEIIRQLIWKVYCSVRYLRTEYISCPTRRNKAKLHSKAKVKRVSRKDKEIGQDCRYDHEDKDVENFWSFV